MAKTKSHKPKKPAKAKAKGTPAGHEPGTGKFVKGHEGIDPRTNRVLPHGRKSAEVKRRIDDFLLAECNGPADENGVATTITLYEKAVRTACAALNATDELGNVSPTALKAAQTVIAYALGLPRQTLEVQGNIGVNLFAKLDRIREAALAGKVSA